MFVFFSQFRKKNLLCLLLFTKKTAEFQMKFSRLCFLCLPNNNYTHSTALGFQLL